MKNRNFVNLSINPCKMCMPMGAVLAFKGIQNSMMILHGSQGCSTYIRRHMAGHYNEPVDIASSSLNEAGTVYGGSDNLKKALKNLIMQYQPEVIGVATTCLAETIGEDIRRIIKEYQDGDVTAPCIIPVSTPGYGGTQFEGYFAALCSILGNVTMQIQPNDCINVIVPNLSPADVRNIKCILKSFGASFNIFPDVSDTLDAPFKKDYSKMPAGGISIEQVKSISGARATIELCMSIPEELSPGSWLETKYGVPLYRCPMPVGLKNTDLFIFLLKSLLGREVPADIEEERGRLMDAMIDSHKYNAQGRAVIYGEPEQCLYVSEICMENGIRPVLVATGTQNRRLEKLIGEDLRLPDKPVIIDDTDFQTIQALAVEQKANILIGNSDGKCITEREGIPLVRIGFPIHDRVGGQRLVCTGYNGTMRLLDTITNTLLEETHSTYRKKMLDDHYIRTDGGDVMEKAKNEEEMLDEKTKNHPCYSGGACKNARMHIPVAPACNISCNYCNRKFDCVNESRPGVTSEILNPEQALEKFKQVKSKIPNLKVVGIAGPGDALANFENTKRSIELIRNEAPDITVCLSTNGLMLPEYAEELVQLGVTHVTVTINSIRPEIGARIYREINYHGKKHTGIEAAQILQHNQLEGLKRLTELGIICKVNIVMIKGINDSHIEEVVKKVKSCGAFMTNIMPLIPAEGSAFEHMPLTSNREINDLRKKCECDLRQMYHCRQCRADAIGMLSDDRSAEFRSSATSAEAADAAEATGAAETAETAAVPGSREYTIAVASKTGSMVDEHFGHADSFRIYKGNGREFEFVEMRAARRYCTGAEECEEDESAKIKAILRMIEDCDAVAVMRIGYSPSRMLEEKGILTLQTCDTVSGALAQAAEKLDAIKGEGCCA